MKVRVNLFKKTDLSYDIEIHESANMAELICSDNFGLKYCIITDSNLEKSLGKKLLDQFKKQGANAELVSFPSGEKNKNLKTVAGILEKMHEFGFD
ncbi:MAG: 3-dehydroquinate synthase, partial [Candidatus Diapherotrites archaeon CG11_big_fil_rev_8_21_14_0_20_37_9]